MGQIIKYLIIAGITICLAVFLSNSVISDPLGATTRRQNESRTANEAARLQSEAQKETASYEAQAKIQSAEAAA